MGRNSGIILQEMTAPEEVPPSASVARVARAPPAGLARAAASVGPARRAVAWLRCARLKISLDALPNIPMLCR